MGACVCGMWRLLEKEEEAETALEVSWCGACIPLFCSEEREICLQVSIPVNLLSSFS